MYVPVVHGMHHPVCTPYVWGCVLRMYGGVYSICMGMCTPYIWGCVLHMYGGVYSICVGVCTPYVWECVLHMYGSVYSICMGVCTPYVRGCVLHMRGGVYSICMGVCTPYAWGCVLHMYGSVYSICMGVCTPYVCGCVLHMRGGVYSICMGVCTPYAWGCVLHMHGWMYSTFIDVRKIPPTASNRLRVCTQVCNPSTCLTVPLWTCSATSTNELFAVFRLCAGHLLLLLSDAFAELNESNLFHQCVLPCSSLQNERHQKLNNNENVCHVCHNAAMYEH